MTPCVYVLLAAWTVGGPEPADSSPYHATPARTPPALSSVEVMPVPLAPAPGSRGLLRRWLGAPHPCPCPGQCMPAAIPDSAPPPQEGAPEELSDEPPSGIPSLTIAPKYMDKVGHEDDYSWITGHLFYVRTTNRWVLRYGQPDQIDRFGGGVELAPAVEMKNFREGDLVCVLGRIVDEGRVGQSRGTAIYRVDNISIVERADP